MADDEDDLTIAAACYNVLMEASNVMSSASPTSQYDEIVTKLRVQSIAEHEYDSVIKDIITLVSRAYEK